jgi:hypothetical protein
MALTQAQKDELVRSGKVSQYVGKSWDEVEKLLNQSSGNTSGNTSNNARTNGTDSGGNIWYTTPDGRQIAVRQGADVILDDNGYFLGTRTQSGRASYTGGSGSSSDQYDEQKKALLSQLRASIAKAKGSYQNVINTAGQTYQPLRNQASLGTEQQLRAMREALANQGNRGGTGRQALLNINTAGQNAQNDINLQQQNVVNDANRAISDLDQQAAFKETEITSDIAAQKIRDAIAAEQRAEDMQIDQERYADSLKQQQFENELAQQELANQQAAERLRNEISSIGAYSNDFQAEINRRQGTASTEDDALIPFLQAARNEKIAAQLAQADNSANQAYKNAYELWKQLGVATSDIAQILNIPVGSKTLDKIKADASRSGGSSSGGGYGLSW